MEKKQEMSFVQRTVIPSSQWLKIYCLNDLLSYYRKEIKTIKLEWKLEQEIRKESKQ